MTLVIFFGPYQVGDVVDLNATALARMTGPTEPEHLSKATAVLALSGSTPTKEGNLNMTTTMTTDLATYRTRLAELKTERDALTTRLADQVRIRDEGHAGTEAAARALIDGGPPFVLDPADGVRQTQAELATNARACSILSAMIGKLELRDGHEKAAPLFAKAMAHAPTIARLLGELEAELRATTDDVRAFEIVQNEFDGLEVQHRDEPPPYLVRDLLMLGEWNEDILGDGVNISRLERWRADLREIEER